MLEELPIVIVALALVAVVPQPEWALRDAVEVIEVNHVHDGSGRLAFTQVIFWDWCPSAGRYHVRAWRMVKEQSQLPRRDHSRGGYVSQWLDGQTLRVVHALGVRETWTQHDVEVAEREVLPVEWRAPLKQ